MTLIEVLVVITVIIFVAFTFLPSVYRHGGPSKLGHCIGNLRQVSMCFLMYAGDNNDKFPMQSSITNGGTMEFLARNETFPHYQKLSPYRLDLSDLICPSETARKPAADYEHLTDANLSYFLNADVSTGNPAASILAGDRALQADGHPVRAGLFLLKTNLYMDWTRELHPNMGCIGFADGHVGSCRGTILNFTVKQQGLAVSHLSVP